MKITPVSDLINTPEVRFSNLLDEDPLSEEFWKHWLGIECFNELRHHFSALGESGALATEPGADLAVLLAIVSSLRNKPLPEKMVVFGEVGLAGEVRPVQRGQERLKEAAKLGFTHAIIPKANAP